jgi:hypothetical protein
LDTVTPTASQETTSEQDPTTTVVYQTSGVKSGEIDLDTDMDAVIQSQINSALASAEVVGRPLAFGSEFTETGGVGLGAKSLTEIMDLNERSRDEVIEVLEETGDSLLQHPFVSEEAIAMACMGARAMARYAILRLERDNAAIMEAIWRLQRVVDENEAELAEIKSHIAQELEKRKFFDDLSSRMTATHSNIESEGRALTKMRGLNDEASDVEDDARKPSWRDRARDVQQANIGMKWKYGAKHSKRPEAPRSTCPPSATQPSIPDPDHLATPAAGTTVGIETDQGEHTGDRTVAEDEMGA